MKKNLSKLPNTAKICENDAKMKIERHKKYWRSLDKQYESDLNNIYAKILQRPFLYEMKWYCQNIIVNWVHTISNNINKAKYSQQRVLSDDDEGIK